MNKKIAILAAAMLLVVSAAGCGQKTANNGTSNAGTEQTDASGAYEAVDMEKLDGVELSSDTDKEYYEGELGDAEITIGDVKVIEYNDADVAIVSFEYKNNSSTETPFTGAVKAEAYQDDSRLAPTVVTDVDGIDMLAISENIAKGDKTVVQKAYILNDKSTPLVIEVVPVFAQEGDTGLVKEFEF